MFNKDLIRSTILLISAVFASKDRKQNAYSSYDNQVGDVIRFNKESYDQMIKFGKNSNEFSSEMIDEFTKKQNDIKTKIDDHLITSNLIKPQITNLRSRIAALEEKNKNSGVFRWFSEVSEHQELLDLKKQLAITERLHSDVEKNLIELNTSYNSNQDLMKEYINSSSNRLEVSETSLIETPISINNNEQSVLIQEPVRHVNVTSNEPTNESSIIETSISVNNNEQTVLVEEKGNSIKESVDKTNTNLIETPLSVNNNEQTVVIQEPVRDVDVTIKESADYIPNIKPLPLVYSSLESSKNESNIIPECYITQTVYTEQPIENEPKFNIKTSTPLVENNTFKAPICPRNNYSDVIFDRFNCGSESLISMENTEQKTDKTMTIFGSIRQQFSSLLSHITWIFQKITFSSNGLNPLSYFIITLFIVLIIFLIIKYKSKISNMLFRIPNFVYLKKKIGLYFINRWKGLKKLISSIKISKLTITKTKKEPRRKQFKRISLDEVV